MSLEVAPDGRVFFVERGGAVKIYNPATNSTSVAGQLSVFQRERTWDAGHRAGSRL